MAGIRAAKCRGEHIGHLVITPNAYVSYVIAGVGGFLGLGQNDVAVPAKQFKGLNGKLILPGATTQALKSLPAFLFAR